MIIYSSTKEGFLSDVFNGTIADQIDSAFYTRLGRHTSPNEKISWKNSMMYMNNVLNTSDIPDNINIAIEYQVPLTSKRIDFIISGTNEYDKEHIIIIELKQWDSAQITNKDGIVKTRFQQGESEVAHPSYQAWSYAAILYDFNESIREENITINPYAYLHNYAQDNVISNSFYQSYIDKAPLFLKNDAGKLRSFIKKHIKHASKKDILFIIEKGRIVPSKQLADSISLMLKGNKEFVLLDEQKVVYETVISMLSGIRKKMKQVLIVEGGPGTGKSVVAINLLAELTNKKFLTQYVSKNAAPREVYAAKLSGDMNSTRIKSLFVGSGNFTETEKDLFDVLIVDEAHRLNYKSGLYRNKGSNQILEIINASKISIFFVDDNQKIHIDDIGTKTTIEKYALEADAIVQHAKLSSQFRCNGSDGYLNWLDNTLQIRETANFKLSPEDFDFRIFLDPNELREEIIKKNRINNKSRLVAGYCWDWISQKDSSAYDINIDEFGFKIKWNLKDDGSKWIIAKESINEIGCIHTCQGLELDYVGVIIGNDLRFENGKVITDVSKRSTNDRSIFGIKTMLRESPEEAKQLADQLIKNTYRTLMTRGMKGCYVYFCDPNLSKHFRQQLEIVDTTYKSSIEEQKTSLIRVEETVSDHVKYVDFLPLYSIKAACGAFGNGEIVDEIGWIKVNKTGRLNRNMFIVRASGHSMEPIINDRDYCVFRSNVVGSRNGKIVLVQHYNHYDSDNAGSYSIKRYTSEKKVDKDTGEWSHQKIILSPENKKYTPIILNEEDENFMVIGELIEVLK